MKIALCGTAPSSSRLAPYGSPDWKIWGCSPGLYGIAPKVDVWFEIHRWEPGQPWFSPEYCQFIKNFKGPVWMAEAIRDVPNCQVLPAEHLVNKYSPYFFTSTIAWMFALAIEEIENEWAQQDKSGLPRSKSSIGLWGVDMAAFPEEYGYQRAGCQYFALLAKAKGIEVGVPPESDLLRPSPLYGVCETSHQWIKVLARKRELQERIAAATQRRDAAYNEILCLSGAVEGLDWQANTWAGNTDTLDRKYTEPTFIPALVNLTDKTTPEEKITLVKK